MRPQLRIVGGQDRRPTWYNRPLRLPRFTKGRLGLLALFLGCAAWAWWVARSPHQSMIIGWTTVALTFVAWRALRSRIVGPAYVEVHHHHHHHGDTTMTEERR